MTSAKASFWEAQRARGSQPAGTDVFPSIEQVICCISLSSAAKNWHPLAVIWLWRWGCGYELPMLFEGFFIFGNLIRTLDLNSSGKLNPLSTFCVKPAELYHVLSGYCSWKLMFSEWEKDLFQERPISMQAFQTKECTEPMRALSEKWSYSICLYWKNPSEYILMYFIN